MAVACTCGVTIDGAGWHVHQTCDAQEKNKVTSHPPPPTPMWQHTHHPPTHPPMWQLWQNEVGACLLQPGHKLHHDELQGRQGAWQQGKKVAGFLKGRAGCQTAGENSCRFFKGAGRGPASRGKKCITEGEKL